MMRALADPSAPPIEPGGAAATRVGAVGELVTHILGIAYDSIVDRQTVNVVRQWLDCVASRVCKAWRPLAERLVFRHVDVQWEPSMLSYGMFHQLFDEAEEHPAWTPRDALDPPFDDRDGDPATREARLAARLAEVPRDDDDGRFCAGEPESFDLEAIEEEPALGAAVMHIRFSIIMRDGGMDWNGEDDSYGRNEDGIAWEGWPIDDVNRALALMWPKLLDLAMQWRRRNTGCTFSVHTDPDVASIEISYADCRASLSRFLDAHEDADYAREVRSALVSLPDETWYG